MISILRMTLFWTALAVTMIPTVLWYVLSRAVLMLFGNRAKPPEEWASLEGRPAENPAP